MSIFRMCPHNNQECVHEIYSGEPDYKWCKKCSVYKSMQNASEVTKSAQVMIRRKYGKYK